MPEHPQTESHCGWLMGHRDKHDVHPLLYGIDHNGIQFHENNCPVRECNLDEREWKGPSFSEGWVR